MCPLAPAVDHDSDCLPWPCPPCRLCHTLRRPSASVLQSLLWTSPLLASDLLGFRDPMTFNVVCASYVPCFPTSSLTEKPLRPVWPSSSYRTSLPHWARAFFNTVL